MYSKLKAVMRSKGYTPSEGGEWAASDTPQFEAFAKFVLGAQSVSANQVLAYPQAFPVLMEALRALDEGDEPAAAEPIDPPQAEVAPVLEPETAPIDPPAEDTADSAPQEDTPAEDVVDADEATEGTDTPADEAPQE